MIYGIGAKALGEQLDVEENDAAVFMETFKAKYPGRTQFLHKMVDLQDSKNNFTSLCFNFSVNP